MDDAGALSGDDGLAHPVQSRRVFLELRQQGGREIVSCLVRKDRLAEIDEGAGLWDSFPCFTIKMLDEIRFASHPF